MLNIYWKPRPAFAGRGFFIWMQIRIKAAILSAQLLLFLLQLCQCCYTSIAFWI